MISDFLTQIDSIPHEIKLVLLLFFAIILLLLIFLFKRKKVVSYGLAEGPTTAFELSKDTQLRKTYSNYKEQMMSVLSESYDDLEVISSGGMGIILKGRDRQTKRFVAIKTISPKLQKDPKAIKFFFHEIQAIQKMNHPNIIRIFDSANDGFLYYTMEYLEGQPLEEYMNEHGILPPKDILRIGTQIARALQHCHSNGIVHRDIKPSNIFLIKDKDVCKIIDFGVVKVINSGTKETGAIGSPNYASPEQIQCGEITGKSDIYALGVVLFKMSTTQFPYKVSDLVDKIFDQAKDIRSLNHQLPVELAEIIMNCINVDPKARFDANELWARLKKVKL